MDCRGAFVSETEDELMKHVQLHAAEAHPGLTITPELAEKVKSLREETPTWEAVRQAYDQKTEPFRERDHTFDVDLRKVKISC